MTKIDKLLKDLSAYIDWREGKHDEMPQPTEIGLVLKECYNIIHFVDMEVRYSKDAGNSISNIKDRLNELEHNNS